MKLSRPSRVLAPVFATAVLLAACTVQQPPQPSRSPEEIRAQIVHLMPARVSDRSGWAADIQAAFAAQRIDPSTQNLCATLAVAAQESGFIVDAPVPDLGRIALAEIDRRAGEHHVPAFLVHAALRIASHDGKSYEQRLAAARTEQDLSRIYEEFIASVPLGKRLFEGDNPIRTVGPMQVSVDFAAQYRQAHPYPYPMHGTIRDELFTRRGGVYFGIAHLLDYPTSYTRPLYRFADYNAGHYASRNAAFQQAVTIASGIPLALDGDVVRYDQGENAIGNTEVAVRSLAGNIDLTDAQIHRSLQQGESIDFEHATLYERVYNLAEQRAHKPLPRAIVPQIELVSPKITRKLTTQWYAGRIEERYEQCLARAAAP
jgi:hypothetical protein